MDTARHFKEYNRAQSIHARHFNVQSTVEVIFRRPTLGVPFYDRTQSTAHISAVTTIADLVPRAAPPPDAAGANGGSVVVALARTAMRAATGPDTYVERHRALPPSRHGAAP